MCRLGRSYSAELASGFRKNHVPFGQLIGHMSQFVDPKYLPQTIAFKDPHNMTKEAIVELCTHIRERQETHGVHDASVFRQYADKGKMIPSMEAGQIKSERQLELLNRRRVGRQKPLEKPGLTRWMGEHEKLRWSRAIQNDIRT